ncbi:hypothetical protein [Sphingomonas parva]|uniref:hypothetical protein n=1 Tax=Sphingomonas parva TaxID=2555898 RepID=UPI00178670DD|nr:hypothetical protein [Sphingomonas parva]
MDKLNSWRREADRKLAAPVTRTRAIASVIGKVEDRFEAIYDARKRGMPWKVIAAALEDGETLKVDAVESAVKRLCKERDLPVPKKKGAARQVAAAHSAPAPAPSPASAPAKAPAPAPASKTAPAPARKSAVLTGTAVKASDPSVTEVRETSSPAQSQTSLFHAVPERWVDDGE